MTKNYYLRKDEFNNVIANGALSTDGTNLIANNKVYKANDKGVVLT